MSFLLICSNMYNLLINKLYILRGNLYICPHNRKVCVTMVILFYPATRAHVHFTSAIIVCYCRQLQALARPGGWGVLNSSVQLESLGPVQLPLVIFTFDVKFSVNLHLLETSVSSLHPSRYCCGHFQFISGNSEQIKNFW